MRTGGSTSIGYAHFTIPMIIYSSSMMVTGWLVSKRTGCATVLIGTIRAVGVAVAVTLSGDTVTGPKTPKLVRPTDLRSVTWTHCKRSPNQSNVSFL